MSALRWTRGAAGLGRALSSSGRRRPTSEEGTLSGLCSSRRSSAARPREQGAQKEWGHAELLEVLEARVRQLQAESVSEVMVKKVQVERPFPKGRSSHWAQKLEAEKQLKRKRQEGVLDMQQKSVTLHMEPQVWSKKLADCLKQSKRGAPGSPEEEKQLSWALRAALQAALPRPGPYPSARTKSKEVEPNILLAQQKFLAFFQCCACTDNVPLAHHVLVTQHSKCDKQQLLTLDMYNTMMLAWARKGSFKELVYVFIMLKDAGLSPDLCSYAAILQCMGRRDQDVHIIQRCLKQMLEEGFQPQQLFTELVLPEEERAALLRAVLKAEPAFRLPPQAPNPVNTCTLLQEVYAKKGPKSYPKLHLPLKTLQDLYYQQLHMELSANVCVQSVEKAPIMTKEVMEARETVKTLQERWEVELLQAIRQTKTTMLYEAHEGQATLYPFLCLLSEEEFVSMLMQVLQRLTPQGQPLLHLAHELGLRVVNRHLVKQKQVTNHVQKLGQQYLQYLQLLASDTQVETPCLPREYWESLGPLEIPQQQPWSLAVLLQLGKQLAELLVQTIQMPRSLGAPQGSCHLIPVLYHVYSFRSYRQVGILKPHPAFMQLLETAANPTLTFETTQVPMLCPPLPWMSPHTGAYLLNSTKLMRAVEGIMQHQHLLERCAPAQLHGALDTLTQLGNCTWRVNERLLDLVLQIFRDKGCTRLGIPPPRSEAPRPPQQHLPPGSTPLRKAELRKEIARCLKTAREMHSLRSEALYRLSLAHYLRKRVFWLPHNMDFRGRTYPCPPHFNHLGSDLARALLEFAEGRPLGPQGLDWLKIHLVNLTGLKKRDSLSMRLAFADEVMEEILDSADNPMTGRKWWMEADDPWQTLACCMEVARAVRSPDPAAYISHLPVHQDGSCNGLQHYAALGRDSTGAASVNLTPSDMPQDVYREVAAQVEEFCQYDAKEGLRVAQVLKGYISRKVVKQTVMTVVYGVTRYGGRLQIEKRLRELNNFPQEFVWEASHYLVRLVFKSLQEMFSSTRAIQHWLSESANLISHAGWPVEWVTPLGIPIIQPYHREAKVQVKGGIQSITLTSSMDISQKPNTLKQRNGFPPNFIHSLDSSHMMLTALHCYRKGLTFVSVHDCFWTHAADIPVMNEVCREQFVRLHSQPILKDLAEFLEKRFCSASRPMKPSERALVSKLQGTLRSLPKTGTFDLGQVMRSTYFFS